MLTQALSNTVTANESLVARLWESYMNLPEDQVVLMCVSYFRPSHAAAHADLKPVDCWDLQMRARC